MKEDLYLSTGMFECTKRAPSASLAESSHDKACNSARFKTETHHAFSRQVN